MKDDYLDTIQTTGLSVKNLKDSAYIARVLYSKSSSPEQAVSRAVQETFESILHSSITSDAAASEAIEPVNS